MPADSIKITAPPELKPLIARLTGAERLKASTDAAEAFAPALTRYLIEQSLAVQAGSSAMNKFSRAWLAQPQSGSKPGLTITNYFGKAKYVEFPTRPHVIEAKPGGMLSWIPGRAPFSAVAVKSSTKAAAGRIFAKKVHHPGFRGYGAFELVMKGKGGTELFRALAVEAFKYLKGIK